MNQQRRSFLALAASGALAGAAPAGAQTTAAAPRLSSAQVATRGIVSAAPESVSFSGQARISSRFAPDPDFNSPHVVVTLDLRGITGTGSQTRATYTIPEVEVVQRRLAPSHRIEVTFPYVKSGDPGAPQTGVAVFLLDFDTATGALTGSSASITSPNFGR